MLPLDLHVLSLSLAFILSQDQTLRCSNCFMSLLKIPLFPGSSIFTDGIHSKYLYYCCICKFLKELLSIVSFETWCKGKDFYFYLPNFFRSFFDLFFSEVLSERLQDIRLDLPTSSLGFYLSGFPNLSFIMSTPHLSRLRVQKYCFITYPPNVFTTFFDLFFAFPDCQGIMNALFLPSFRSDFFFPLDFVSPFFWLDPKEPKGQGYTSKATNSLHSAKIPDNSRFALRQPGFLYAPLAICFTPSPLGRSFFPSCFPFFPLVFSSFNSQFSILHSQLTKSRRVFIISRRLFSKRRRLFLFLCLPF